MIAALKAAIVAQAVTVSGITASNVFYVQAPDAKSGLYVVYSGIPFQKNWDSEASHYPFVVQFNFYNSTESALQTAVDNFETAFDFTPLTVAGFHALPCLPSSPTIPTTKIEDIWQAVLTYQIEISKLRS